MKKKYLSPYFLKRKCNKACTDDRFYMSEILDIEKEIKKTENKLNKNLNFLEETLHEEIGKLPKECVKAAIKVKKHIRKCQFHKLQIEDTYFMSEDSRSILNECVGLQALLDELKNKQILVNTNNKDLTLLNIIKEIKNNNLFNNALMISMNEEFYKNLTDLCKHTQFPQVKKLRDTILSVENYYNRMLHKPSPFSTFVDIEMGIIDSNKTESSEINYSAQPQVSLNILFLHILESFFLNDNKNFMESFFIKVNPTINSFENHYEFLNVDTKNPKYMYYKENFVSIAKNAKIDSILSKLSNKNINAFSLASAIVSDKNVKFSNAQEALIYIFKLTEIGLLYKNFNIDQVNDNLLDKLITLCDIPKSQKYLSIKSALINIRQIISEMNEGFTDTFVRKLQREKIYENISEILAVYSVNAKDLNFKVHNILYENNVNPQITAINKVISKQDAEKISCVEKLYRIFDNNYISKILYRGIFLKKYKPDDRIPVLQFYKLVTECSNQHEIISNDVDIKSIGKIRKAYFEILKNNMSEDIVNISTQQVKELFKQSPKILKTFKSYGIYYQKCAGNIVVNNTAPGYGRHFMRYVSDLNDNSQNLFLSNYKDYINKISNEDFILADIGNNLGLNINQHVESLAYAFPYPKAVYRNADYHTNFFVVYDKENEILRIEDEKRKIIEITPIGFLFPRVAPGYYRFLSTFSNSQGVELSFWDRFHSYFNGSKDSYCHYPKVVLDNNVIIERETWKIPTQNINTDDNDEISSYLNIAGFLCMDLGIPKRFFAKISTDVDGILVKQNNMENWMKEISNRKLRKPQFYDLDKYTDFRNILSIIKNHSAQLTIQEALPDCTDITEYLIEFVEID